MDPKAKPKPQKAVLTRATRGTKDSVADSPRLYLSRYPRQHMINHKYNQERNRKAIDPNSAAVRTWMPMRNPSVIPVAKVGAGPRTQVHEELGLMPGPEPARSEPDTKTAQERICAKDDVFGTGIDAGAKPDAKHGKDEIGTQGVLKGRHREHSTAVKQPHRRPRPQDNLNNIFEAMRAQRQIPSIEPEPTKTYMSFDLTKPTSAWEHYMEFVISSTRARAALVSFRERTFAEPRHHDDSRFKDDALFRLVIQRSIERLVAEAENLERSCLGREVDALERKARARLI